MPPLALIVAQRRGVLSLAAAMAVASCSGDSGGPQTPSFDPTACSLLWYRARPAGIFDLYKVEMPAADWTSGTHAFDGTSRLGVFYYGLFDGDGDGLFEGSADAASATSGSFTLDVDGVDEGDAVVFDDPTLQSYLGLGAVVIATGGTGGFDGVWSSPDVDGGGEDPEYADTASIAVAYEGSSLALGSIAYGAFGLCWDDATAASSITWRQPLNPQ